MSIAIHIASASVTSGVLTVAYSVNGSGGNSISVKVTDIPLLGQDLGVLDLVELIIRWANAKRYTPAQVTGKTITFDMTQLANLVSVS